MTPAIFFSSASKSGVRKSLRPCLKNAECPNSSFRTFPPNRPLSWARLKITVYQNRAICATLKPLVQIAVRIAEALNFLYSKFCSYNCGFSADLRLCTLALKSLAHLPDSCIRITFRIDNVSQLQTFARVLEHLGPMLRCLELTFPPNKCTPDFQACALIYTQAGLY